MTSYIRAQYWGGGGALTASSERLIYRDEIPDFLFWTTMAKIRNTGISSLYLVKLVNAQHKK